MELQFTDRTPEGLIRAVRAMIDKELPLVSNLANLSRVLYDGFSNVFWSGFYLSDETRNVLYLGPYQGTLACTRIAFGRGSAAHLRQNKKRSWCPMSTNFRGTSPVPPKVTANWSFPF